MYFSILPLICNNVSLILMPILIMLQLLLLLLKYKIKLLQDTSMLYRVEFAYKKTKKDKL